MNTLNSKQFKQLLPLFFLIFIDTIGYFIVLPVVLRLFMPGPDTILPVDASVMTRTMLYSVTLMLSPLAFIICSPLIGYCSDRYGRKKALTGSLFIALIGLLLPVIGIQLKKVSLILIGRFIAGASSSSQPVAQAGVTDFTSGKVRAFSLSLIGFAMTLGMVIGPLSGGYLSDHHLVSWFTVKTPYYFAFLLALTNIVMIILFYKDSVQKKASHVPFSLRLFTKDRIWVWLLCFFLLEMSWSQYYQASFLILSQRFHYTMNKVSLFAAYAGFWMCIGLTVIYKWLIKKYAIESIAKGSLFISATAFAFCSLPSSNIQWIMIIPATIAIGTGYPSLLAAISLRTAPCHQGYMLGCASTLLGIAWMVTGLLTGILSSLGLEGGGGAPILILLSTILSGISFCILTRRKHTSA